MMKKHKMCRAVCGAAYIILVTITLSRAFPTSNKTEDDFTTVTPDEVRRETENVPITFSPKQKQKEIQFYWEVTKVPGETKKSLVKEAKRDMVDGNHPNMTAQVTHEEIDTSIGVGEQTKRVKKILPPYHSDPKKVKNQTEEINKNIEKINHNTSSESLRPAVVEEFTVTEIRHADFSRDKPLSEEANNKQQKTSTSNHERSEEHVFFNKFPDNNATEKNSFASENPIQVINMQNKPSHGDNKFSRTILDATSEADLIFEGESNDRTKAGDVGSKAEFHTESLDSEIHGIRLVPDEADAPTPSIRTMWDLIQEQQAFASEEKGPEVNNAIYPEPRALPYQTSRIKEPHFGNFDTESAEVEYETENFQHGLSNIEKHELPFSYALPWLEIQDKELGLKENEKETDKKLETRDNKEEPHSPRSFAAVSSDEELRIPADMSRLLRLSQVPELEKNVALNSVQSGVADTEAQGRTKWYLLLLTGNSTIVQRRRSDFTKYLRLNLAARLSVEYDDVKVNKLVLASPLVLVNVSVYAPSDDVAEESQLDLKERFEEKGEGPLHKLAENNATLLELSGEEYRVVRFLSLQAPLETPQSVPQPVAQAQRDDPQLTSMSSRHHEDIEYVIFTFLGSACACAVILTLFLAFNKYLKKWKEWNWPWKYGKVKRSQRLPEEIETHSTIPPAVIYSGGFPQIRGSWMGNGAPGLSEPPSNSASNASLLQRYPGIELGSSQPESPRHNKLRIYNCTPDRVLVRKLQDSCVEVKDERGQDNTCYDN